MVLTLTVHFLWHSELQYTLIIKLVGVLADSRPGEVLSLPLQSLLHDCSFLFRKILSQSPNV